MEKVFRLQLNNVIRLNVIIAIFIVILTNFAYAKSFKDVSADLVMGVKNVIGLISLVLVFVFIVNIILYIVSDWGEGSANLKMRIVWGIVSLFVAATLYGILHFIEDVTLGGGDNVDNAMSLIDSKPKPKPKPKPKLKTDDPLLPPAGPPR